MRKWIFIIILVAGAIGLFVLYTDPIYQDAKEVRDEISQYDETLDNSKKFQKRKKELVTKFNNLPEDKLDRLDTMLPNNIHNIHLIINIDDIASENGLSINNIKVSEGEEAQEQEDSSTPGENYGNATMSFRVSSSYDRFLSFLRDLEGSLRVIDIESISFVSQPDSDVYEFDVTLKTYWLYDVS